MLGIDENTPLLMLMGIPILIFIWFNIIYTVLSIPFGKWSDIYGRKAIFAVGLSLFMLTCTGFVFTTDLIFLFIFFGIYGAFNAATDGVQKAFAVDLLPSNLRGTGIGLLQTITGFAGIAGGLIAGFLYSKNESYAFIYGAGMSTISLGLLMLMNFSHQEEKNDKE